MKGRRYPQPLAQPSLRAVRTVIPRFATDFVVLQFAPKSVLLCSFASRGCRLGGDAKGTRPTVGFHYYVVKWPTTAALKAGPPGQRAHCLLEFGRCVDCRMYRPRTKRDSRGQGGLAVVMNKMCGNGGTSFGLNCPHSIYSVLSIYPPRHHQKRARDQFPALHFYFFQCARLNM
jgi:hypothetical protein